jgi:hypothetical protein
MYSSQAGFKTALTTPQSLHGAKGFLVASDQSAPLNTASEGSIDSFSGEYVERKDLQLVSHLVKLTLIS